MHAAQPWTPDPLELSLTDVRFLHAKLADAKESHRRRAQQPRRPDASRPPSGADSPRKKGKAGKNKGGKKGGKGGKEKKKSKKELAEEAAGYIIKQRKILHSSYVMVAAKLGEEPLEPVLGAMGTHESVAMSQDEREEAGAALTSLVFDKVHLGPAHTRALACALVGEWVGQTETAPPEPPTFAEKSPAARPTAPTNPALEAIARAEARDRAMLAASAYLSAAPTNSMAFAPHYELMQHLHIYSGQIRSAGAVAVAGLLKHRHCTLQSLRLCSKNKIGVAGARALGDALSFRGGNRSLIELHLDGDDSIGDNGTIALCSGLELNSSLKVLSMASCGVRAAGALAIAQMLKSTRSGITYLNLEVNTFGADGLEALCSLGLSNRLRVINLASAGIWERDSLRAVTALGNALDVAKCLQAVDFNLNPLTAQAAAELTRLLARARRNGSDIEEFIVTTELSHDAFAMLNLDPSTISSWTQTIKHSGLYRRTPSPFIGSGGNAAGGINLTGEDGGRGRGALPSL